MRQTSINTRMTHTERQTLATLADGRSLSSMVRDAIKEYVENRSKKFG